MVDLTGKPTQAVFDLFQQGRLYNAVITVFDKEAAERCPLFPGNVKRIPWTLKDPWPYAFTGTREEVIQHTREVRGQIEQQIKAFVRDASAVSYWLY